MRRTLKVQERHLGAGGNLSLTEHSTPGLQEATDLIPLQCSRDWIISGFQVLRVK